MLRKNLDVARGLVNGSLGTVREIIFKRGERPPSLPQVIMVEFDRFTGPFIRDRLYPVSASRANWKTGVTECSRKQIPLNLAYSITIHKSQGLTLDKAIVDIGPRETTPGLSYVALSRVRKFTDLIILNTFDYQRLSKISENRQVIEREQFLASRPNI